MTERLIEGRRRLVQMVVCTLQVASTRNFVAGVEQHLFAVMSTASRS